MTEKERQEIGKQGKNKLRKLIFPRPTDSCLASRMFDYTDWLLNIAEDRQIDICNNCEIVACEGCIEHEKEIAEWVKLYEEQIDLNQKADEIIAQLKSENKKIKEDLLDYMNKCNCRCCQELDYC